MVFSIGYGGVALASTGQESRTRSHSLPSRRLLRLSCGRVIVCVLALLCPCGGKGVCAVSVCSPRGGVYMSERTIAPCPQRQQREQGRSHGGHLH